VVNEALNDDGTMRPSPWYRIIGEGFIVKAFQFAHEADPQAELYYNDYSLENEAKRKGAVELIGKLKAAGVAITGIGLQDHNHMDTPAPQQEAETIKAFAALGIRVNISELDVDVLPRTTRLNTADVSATAAGTAGSNPWTASLPKEMQQALATRYAELFAVFVQHHKVMGRVTFWSDRRRLVAQQPAREWRETGCKRIAVDDVRSPGAGDGVFRLPRPHRKLPQALSDSGSRSNPGRRAAAIAVAPGQTRVEKKSKSSENR
jgi:GH35 family endo-1,4-beta-xylanase